MPQVNRNEPKRAQSSESQYSLVEFMQEFPDDNTCLEWLWRTRYSEDGEHAECPKCKTVRVFERYETKQQRQSWTCAGCGHHLHPTAGTIFHKSSTSLHLWFYAMYLITSTRCGISAKRLERELGVTYKTAWRMFNLIRTELMKQDPSDKLGAGAPVEVDETYIGGRPRYRSNKRGRRPIDESSKVPVVGAVQRGGRVFACKVESVKASTLTGFVTERVYVSGDVHTNTIEGFWSLVKRRIGGVYHAVSAKPLDSYLSEYVWRYNQRLNGRDRFHALLLRSVL